MSDWLAPFGTALLAGMVGAWTTYLFSLRRDKEERRRERIVAHLIEAYRNLENAAGRDPLSDKQKDLVESSIAATFLLGSKEAAEEAKKLAIDVAAGVGSMLPLLRILRKDLRHELGLEIHDAELKFLRFERDEGNGK